MKLTPKENYLMLGRGEMPEYVPFYTMMGTEYMGEAPVKSLSPMVFKQDHFRDGGYDMWGVRYVADANTGATLPEPNHFLLEDINDWEKVLKFPDRNDDFDYEMMYKKDLEERKIDRNQSATIAMAGLMPFQQLVAFMGFTEGLCALATDPDVVSDMLNAMVDWIEPVLYKTIEYYKPDLWYMLDDTAAKATPFFSLETYREVFLPIYRRLAKPATDRGIPIQFHNCGKCEIFVEDMIDFGVRYWDPAELRKNTKARSSSAAAGIGIPISRTAGRITMMKKSFGKVSVIPLINTPKTADMLLQEASREEMKIQ